IKKYGKPECVFCNPVLLPPDIFKEVYWIPDSQKSSDCLSKQSKKDKKEYALQGILEQKDLEILFEQYDYTCGSKLLSESHSFYNTVFVKVNLTCESQIKQLYYSSKVAHKDICIFCEEDDLAEKPENLEQK
ncbi:14382_t:CDS:2, partial [Funneliformis mosseae]